MGPNHNDGHKSRPQVMIQHNIGLDRDVRLAVVDLLNIILADETLLTIKTRCAQWNVRGPAFYELHTLFESQQQLLNHISDEIAERAPMLGGIAIGSLEEFSSHTRLQEQIGVVPDVLHLLADHEACIRYLREDVRRCSEEYEDQGTLDVLVRVMRVHEKMAWMLRSYVVIAPNVL